ncbi:hypothetical protein F4860DRAFT_102386 [Xylaria cubensis]|nr:hypothetical protein F4860DRAFT_102386 [Xylaria cubensis]
MARKRKGSMISMETNKRSRQIRTSDAQKSSMLFQIPQELRDMIYTQLFINTRLSHGHRVFPAANALSILRTCRRARAEIGDSWLGQVLFHFNNVDTMLTKLAALPMAALSKIRHMRILWETLKFEFAHGASRYYRIVHFLKLLPGLRLDTLTVIDTYNSRRSYDILNMLIRYSQGWKELRFISGYTSLLEFPPEEDRSIREAVDITDRYQRKPQPADWINVMKGRDGVASEPSVAIYYSILRSRYCTVTNEAIREKYGEEPGAEDRLSRYLQYAPLMTFDERNKEFMVVVRRGRGIDYQEKLGSPFLAIDDIRQDCPGMSWAEIKKQYTDRADDSNDSDALKSQDVYNHPDEYLWE